MRPALLLALLAFCPARGSQYDDLRINTVAFDKHYDRFARDLFGCPAHGDATPATCHETPTVNYKEYLAARKAAMKLFALREEK